MPFSIPTKSYQFTPHVFPKKIYETYAKNRNNSVNRFEALLLAVARKLIDMFKLAELLLYMCVSIYCNISIT